MKCFTSVFKLSKFYPNKIFLKGKVLFCNKIDQKNCNNNKNPNINKEEIKISHNYELDSKVGSITNSEDKQTMDKLIKEFLRESNTTKEELETLKQSIRDPMHFTEGPNVFKIHTNQDAKDILIDIRGIFDNHYAFKKVSKLINLRQQENRENDSRFMTIRTIDRVLLNSEIPQELDKNRNQSPNLNSPDYLNKQERVEVNYNYNYEEHKDFTKRLKDQKIKDEERLLQEKKYFKYLKDNKDDPEIKSTKISRLTVPIEKIPDFDVDTSNYQPKRSQKSRRLYDRKLHDINISNYDAWRCWDREIESVHPGDGPSINVLLPPNLVVKAFGQPTTPENSFYTGTYYFEDSNLDIFLLTDFKQTTHFHGFNYSEEFYKKIQMDIHPRKRKTSYPEIGEFWKSEEPKEFKIYFSIYAEARKFRMWLRKMIEDYKDSTVLSKIDQLQEKFGKIDDYTDYNKEREIYSGEMPVYKYTPAYFMGDIKSKILHEVIEKPKEIKIDEGELFLYDEYLLQEAEKGYNREKKKKDA